MRDPIVEAAVKVASGNDGEPTTAHTWQVSESAQFHLSGTGSGHLLEGAVIAWWL